MSGTSVFWSEGNNILGYGSEFEASFSEGDHIVTVTAMDSDGNTAQDSVRFRIDRFAIAKLSIQPNPDRRTYRVSWPALVGGVLQSSRLVTGPYQKADLPVRLEGDDYVVDIDPVGPAGFFRLGPE